MHDDALIILAGGGATRCGRKLERPIGNLPMLVHTYRNLRGFVRTYIALNQDVSVAVRSELDAELMFDRVPLQGPLSALVNAFEQIREPRVFVVAADMPFATSATLKEIAARWQAGDEAIVALDADKPQPLLALYDREAFLRAAATKRDEKDGVQDILSRLRWRSIELQDVLATFNVNTEEQYSAANALRTAAMA